MDLNSVLGLLGEDGIEKMTLPTMDLTLATLQECLLTTKKEELQDLLEDCWGNKLTFHLSPLLRGE